MKKNYPSLFFPLALIAAGAMWLLIQAGIVPRENVWALTHVWPFVLIALGLGLILRGVWHDAAGIVVSVLIVGGVFLAVMFAPRLGWAQAPANWGGMEGNVAGGVPGSGKMKRETRPLPSFDALEIQYPVEALIRQGDSESITIEAEDNLLPQLRAEVKNGKLIFGNAERDWSKRVRPSLPVKIIVTVKELRAIDFDSAGTLRIESLQTDSLRLALNGAGDVKIDGLKADSLECEINGAGGIEAAGATRRAEIRIDGFGDFKGKNLKTADADVTVNGAGGVEISVTESLNAELNGAGSVGYYGSPNVNQKVNGAGSVKKLDE